MKLSLAKKDYIFCTVDIWVNLVEPRLFQNHADISDIGPQESVSIAQNVFELVLDLNHCDLTLVNSQWMISHS